MSSGNLLVVDDEALVRDSLQRTLSHQMYMVSCVASGEEALRWTGKRVPDVVLLDIALPGISGMETLKTLHGKYPEVPVIMITAHTNVNMIIEATRNGAFHYMVKPFSAAELLDSVRQAIQAARRKRRRSPEPPKRVACSLLNKIICVSDTFRRVLIEAEQMAASEDTTVLIEGESGCGKELFAHYIHACSTRRKGLFVPINCGALPADLIEMELFGYDKGAFTGALREGKPGKFEIADGGTIYLDEIVELPLASQVKFLRILENREFYPIGSARSKKIGLRVVASTNQNVEQLVEEKRFREDLYYRINIARLWIPPLREHAEDILPISNAFLEELNQKRTVAIQRISPPVEQLLQDHPWKGNVRELRNAIERAAIVTKGDTLEESAFHFLREPSRTRREPETNGKSPFTLPAGGIDFQKVEQDFLRQALARSHGNQLQAAKLVGLSRDTFLYRAKKYAIL